MYIGFACEEICHTAISGSRQSRSARYFQFVFFLFLSLFMSLDSWREGGYIFSYCGVHFFCIFIIYKKTWWNQMILWYITCFASNERKCMWSLFFFYEMFRTCAAFLPPLIPPGLHPSPAPRWNLCSPKSGTNQSFLPNNSFLHLTLDTIKIERPVAFLNFFLSLQLIANFRINLDVETSYIIGLNFRTL